MPGVELVWRRLGTAVTGHIPIAITLKQEPFLLFHSSRCLMNPVFLATLGIQRHPGRWRSKNILPASLVNFPLEASQGLAKVNYPLIQAVRFRAVCEAVSLPGSNPS